MISKQIIRIFLLFLLVSLSLQHNNHESTELGRNLQSCGIGCQTCVLGVCRLCSSSYYLDNFNTCATCIYSGSSTGHCTNCSSSTNCLKCDDYSYLKNGKCLECDYGFYYKQTTQSCSSCTDYGQTCTY